MKTTQSQPRSPWAGKGNQQSGGGVFNTRYFFLARRELYIAGGGSWWIKKTALLKSALVDIGSARNKCVQKTTHNNKCKIPQWILRVDRKSRWFRRGRPNWIRRAPSTCRRWVWWRRRCSAQDLAAPWPRRHRRAPRLTGCVSASAVFSAAAGAAPVSPPAQPPPNAPARRVPTVSRNSSLRAGRAKKLAARSVACRPSLENPARPRAQRPAAETTGSQSPIRPKSSSPWDSKSVVKILNHFLLRLCNSLIRITVCCRVKK